MCVQSQLAEYSIGDLFDLIFPEDRRVSGYMCMVFNAFLDDSGHKQKKLMVSAGFCANKESWADLRADWNQVKTKYGLDYFKSSECNHVDGQFRKLRKGSYAQPDERDEAQKIRQEFLEVVARHRGIKGMGIVVEMEPYQRFAELPGASSVLPSDPYKAALSSIMFEFVKRISKVVPNTMIAFVHDDDDKFDDLRGCYKEFRTKNPKTAKRMGGFQPMDDKTTPELQLADLLANHTAYIAGQQPNPIDNLLEMKRNIQLLGVWNEEYISAILRHGLRRQGKPIPLSLDLESE